MGPCGGDCSANAGLFLSDRRGKDRLASLLRSIHEDEGSLHEVVHDVHLAEGGGPGNVEALSDLIGPKVRFRSARSTSDLQEELLSTALDEEFVDHALSDLSCKGDVASRLQDHARFFRKEGFEEGQSSEGDGGHMPPNLRLVCQTCRENPIPATTLVETREVLRKGTAMVRRMAWVCLMLPAMAMAGPTGLNLIPIADTVGPGECLFGVYSAGNKWDIAKRGNLWHCATIGLTDRIEIGYDNNLNATTYGNVKFRFAQGKNYAISAGVMNFDFRTGLNAVYVVGRYDMSNMRLHAGVYRDTVEHPIIGVDFAMKNGWTGMVEHFGGPSGSTWAGVFIPLPMKGLGLTFSAGLPTDHHQPWQHTINLSYGIRL